MAQSVENDRLREDLDRVLLLLASEPRPGFEAEFEELTRREVDRLLRPEAKDERAGE
jgi:hypothetical protein